MRVGAVFENQQTHQYEVFTTPYAGLCQVIRPDGLYDRKETYDEFLENNELLITK